MDILVNAEREQYGREKPAWMRTDRMTDTAFYIVGWIFLGAFLVYLFLTLYLHREPLRVPPCAIHAVSGYYCPGCGSTRAMHALLGGRLFRAVFYQPFIPYVAVVGGWFMFSQTIERLSRHRAAIGMRFRELYVWIGLVLLLGSMLVKDAILFFTGIAVMD